MTMAGELGLDVRRHAETSAMMTGLGARGIGFVMLAEGVVTEHLDDPRT
jgi:hypothetical protein